MKIIFQPAEEGERGADDVIETGLVNDVDVFFGLHVWSAFPLGEFHVSASTVSAAVDMFRIRVHGHGGHGATPELCADAVAAGADLVSSLQYIVSRALPATEPAVVTVGSFHGGSVGNIIAGEAELKGTVRTITSESRDYVQASHRKGRRQFPITMENLWWTKVFCRCVPHGWRLFPSLREKSGIKPNIIKGSQSSKLGFPLILWI